MIMKFLLLIFCFYFSSEAPLKNKFDLRLDVISCESELDQLDKQPFHEGDTFNNTSSNTASRHNLSDSMCTEKSDNEESDNDAPNAKQEEVMTEYNLARTESAVYEDIIGNTSDTSTEDDSARCLHLTQNLPFVTEHPGQCSASSTVAKVQSNEVILKKRVFIRLIGSIAEKPFSMQLIESALAQQLMIRKSMAALLTDTVRLNTAAPAFAQPIQPVTSSTKIYTVQYARNNKIYRMMMAPFQASPAILPVIDMCDLQSISGHTEGKMNPYAQLNKRDAKIVSIMHAANVRNMMIKVLVERENMLNILFSEYIKHTSVSYVSLPERNVVVNAELIGFRRICLAKLQELTNRFNDESLAVFNQDVEKVRLASQDKETMLERDLRIFAKRKLENGIAYLRELLTHEMKQVRCINEMLSCSTFLPVLCYPTVRQQLHSVFLTQINVVDMGQFWLEKKTDQLDKLKGINNGVTI